MKQSLVLRPQVDSLDSLVLLSAVAGVESLAGPAIVSPAQPHVVTISGTVGETYHSPFGRVEEPRTQILHGELSIDGQIEHVKIDAHTELRPIASGLAFEPHGTMKIVTHDPHRGDIDLDFDFSLASGYTYTIKGGTETYHEASGQGSFNYHSGDSPTGIVLTF